ncbi:6-hydroxymethylpterin diphosphokinase MptE-like protein [Helicobacter sp. 11S02629-2]|uniref:6-hydroxymethylpterin diphosphokinase MptE-like protein n=1 Tax=Helicobacter sp. 11S02629-2 TaxID=1476195 RepID=UPI000BA557CC|nr:6-hydroxymethylpterin diphosphokinase MptE-like protein [Helicobacter sp. 11S02629-2]PAF42526.1 hypothetical protein BKH40_07730 [Helicobacter sp. 11S02629-2]
MPNSNKDDSKTRALSLKYAKNMEFFKVYNPKLFASLKLPPSEFNLVVNAKGFNILNLKTNSLIYPEIDGIYTMEEAHTSLSCPFSSSLWQLSTNHISLNPLENLLDTKRLPLTASFYNALLLKHLSPTFNLQEKLESLSTLPNIMLFGLLGGLFLEKMFKTYKLSNLLIYEDSLDLFRISLYFVSYFDIACSLQDRFLLVVSNLNLELSKKLLEVYFAKNRINNNFLSLTLKAYTSKNLESFMHLSSLVYAQNARGWGSFEDELVGLKNALFNLSACKLLMKNKAKLAMPICVIGSGPSLDLNLSFLKQNQERMILFSAGTALKVLKANGIKPDFQVEIERSDYLDSILKDDLGDTPLIMAQVVDRKVSTLAKDGFFFIRGGSSTAYLDPFANRKDSKYAILENAAPFVGNAAFELACMLSQSVIVTGLDCGYIEGKSKHAKGSFYGDEAKSLPEGTIKIKGNLDLEVYTDSLFALSLRKLESSILDHKANVINIGYGAFIEGSKSAYQETLSLKDIDKKDALSLISSSFLQSSIKVNLDKIRDDFNKFITKLASLDWEKETSDLLYDINALSLDFSSNKDTKVAGILLEGSLAFLAQGLNLGAFFASKTLTKEDKKSYKKLVLDCLSQMAKRLTSIKDT